MEEEPNPDDSVIFLSSSKLNQSGYSSGEDSMVDLIQKDIAKIEPLNTPTKTGNISTTLPMVPGMRVAFSMGLSRWKW